jgi:hypothetical protein
MWWCDEKTRMKQGRRGHARQLQFYLRFSLLTLPLSLSLSFLLIALPLLPGEWRLTMDAWIDGRQQKKMKKNLQKNECNCTPISLWVYDNGVQCNRDE